MYSEWTSKKQIYRELRELLNVPLNYATIALDGNNLPGRDIDQIEQLCTDLLFTPKQKRGEIYAAIQLQADKVINNFFTKIKPVLHYYSPENIFAVFDGRKLIQKYDNANYKSFDWKLPPKPRKANKPNEDRRPKFKTPHFWAIYHYIIKTIQFLLYCLGIRIIIAPYEADHQIVKMFLEGYVKCVFSTDYGYVDYAVPLVKTFRPDGRGLVVDFHKVDLEKHDQILRRWVESTKEDIFRRHHFGLYCDSPYIQAFQALSPLEIMEVMVNGKIPNFFHELNLSRPTIYVPRDYIRAVGEVSFVSWCSTTYSLKNDKLQPLHYANRNKLRPRSQILGPFYNYQPYDPKSFTVKILEGMNPDEAKQFIYQNKSWVFVKEAEDLSAETDDE